MHKTQASTSDSLHALYRECHGELLRFARARVGDWAEAEDILQDLWLQVETRRPELLTNPRSYLFKMANNIIIDRQREVLRRRYRDRMWQDWRTNFTPARRDAADPTTNAEDWLILQEEVARLRETVSRLPDGARRVLHLHKIDGLSHSEVANRLGISRSGVEKHMSVAMRHLRRSLVE